MAETSCCWQQTAAAQDGDAAKPCWKIGQGNPNSEIVRDAVPPNWPGRNRSPQNLPFSRVSTHHNPPLRQSVHVLYKNQRGPGPANKAALTNATCCGGLFCCSAHTGYFAAVHRPAHESRRERHKYTKRDTFRHTRLLAKKGTDRVVLRSHIA